MFSMFSIFPACCSIPTCSFLHNLLNRSSQSYGLFFWTTNWGLVLTSCAVFLLQCSFSVKTTFFIPPRALLYFSLHKMLLHYQWSDCLSINKYVTLCTSHVCLCPPNRSCCPAHTWRLASVGFGSSELKNNLLSVIELCLATLRCSGGINCYLHS